VQEALVAMRGMYEKRSRIKQGGFKGKVKVLATIIKDQGARQECEKILEEQQ
jgi:hypothetical protein